VKRRVPFVLAGALVAVLAGCATNGDLEALEKKLGARIDAVDQKATAAEQKAAAAQAAAEKAAKDAAASRAAADQAARKAEAIFDKSVRK
jgi:murein lipoprotein